MASSCSQENNGCANCAPGLSIWVIEASTGQTMVGLGCINGNNPNPKQVFFQQIARATFNYNGADNVIDLSTNDSSSYFDNTSYVAIIDSYGIIIISSTYFSSLTSNGFYSDEFMSFSFGGGENCRKLSRITSCQPEPDLACSYSGDYINSPPTISPDNWNCFQEVCNESISCTSFTRSGSESSYAASNVSPLWASGSGAYQFRRMNTSPKNLLFFYNLCKSSVSTKISLLETNGPQDCNNSKCGGGKKDDCWGAASSFSIVDNNLDDPNAASTTSQKLKFKIAAIKEGFDKKYKSISGKVIFYYGGTGGKTPCCDDDFDGTVVEERSYSISSGSTFKDDYFAADCGEFDNDDQTLVGETINICYTVDKVDFI